MKKRVFPHLLLILILLFSAGSAAALEYNTTPPDFTLPTPDGQKVSLSDFKGHIIILKLATTWCPTCRQEAQEIFQTAAPELKKAGAVVVEVFLQDTDQMVRETLKKRTHTVTSVALLDDGRVRRAYDVFLIPRVIIIDRNFKVYRDFSGLVPAPKLIKAVKKLARDQ